MIQCAALKEKGSRVRPNSKTKNRVYTEEWSKGMNVKKNHYEPNDREGWLALRASMKYQVGGSELGTIAGHNPYSSFLSLLEERVGIRPPKDLSGKMAVRLGHELEPLVATMFTEKSGKKVHCENCVYENDAYPHLKATIDRKIANEDSGLECKTSFGHAMDKFKPGDFPQAYLDQCICYLAVTNLSRWYLAILTGTDYHVYLMTRVKEEADRYAELKKKFGFLGDESDPEFKEWEEKWAYLEAVYYLDDGELAGAEALAARFVDKVKQVEAFVDGKPFNTPQERLAMLQNAVYQVLEPEDVDGGADVMDAIADLSTPVPDSVVEYSPDSPDGAELLAMLGERKALNAEIEERENKVDAIDAAIALKMNSTETATLPGWKITYKNGTPRRTCSVADLEAYYSSQGVAVPCGLVKTSEAKRSLRVSEVKPRKGKAKAVKAA